MIASVNKSWPKDLIIRYLYVKLAPTFQRDMRFFRNSVEGQLRIYQGPHFFDGTHVYCVTLCEYYKELFQKFGIDTEIIETNSKEVPHHALIVRGDTDLYFIDPLKDLGLNQLGCATRFYGVLPLSRTKDNKELCGSLSVLEPEYLREMDKELGLLKNGVYMDEFFLELKKDLFSRTHYDDILGLIGYDARSAGITEGINIYSRGSEPNDIYVAAKLELMNKYLINLGNVPGPFERKQLYDYIMRHVFTHEELNSLSLKLGFLDEVMITHYTNGDFHNYKEVKYPGDFYSLERKR